MANLVHSQPGAARSPIRIAAIGLGWVALNRHLPVMQRSAAFDLVGVIDRRPGRAHEVAGRVRSSLHAEADALADVPWLDRVDAVTIATAPFGHYRLIKEALQLG